MLLNTLNDKTMMLKESKYNYIYESGGYSYLLNFYSHKVLKLEEKNKELNYLLNGQIGLNEVSEKNLNILRDYGFIIDVRRDELEEIRKEYAKINDPSELEITFIVTHDCNFSCKYCYQEHDERYVMSFDVIDAAISYIKEKIDDIEKIKIHWFGGEPLKELEKILYAMDKINNIARRSGVPVVGHITTNGFLLNERVFIELIRRKILFFQITLDGNEELHNYFRPLKSGKSTFRNIYNNIIEISSNVKKIYEITIRVNSSKVFSENFDVNILPFLNFRDNPRIKFNLQRISNYGDRNEDSVKTLFVNNIEYNELLTKFKRRGLLLNEMMYTKIGAGLCSASKRNSFYINDNGDIAKCDIALFDNTIRGLAIIGSIKNNKIILDEKLHDIWVEQTSYDKQCEDCVLLPICMANTCPYKRIKTKQKSCFRNKDYVCTQLVQTYEKSNTGNYYEK